MQSIKKWAYVAFGCSLVVPVVASADESDPYDYSWHEASLESGIGVSTILGGGISGFTDSHMRDTVSSDVNGLWDLRVTLGSHTPLALDIGYVGTAADIDVLDNTSNATLIGSTVEGALRYNILPHYAWNPYLFAGMGWQNYSVSGEDVNLSDAGINDSDNSIVFPMGGGIAYRDSGFVADVRGVFRANTDSSLVVENARSNTYVPLHTWEASAALGYEF